MLEWNLKLFIKPKRLCCRKSINTLKRKSHLFPRNCLLSRFGSILCTTVYNLDVVLEIRLRISWDGLTMKMSTISIVPCFHVHVIIMQNNINTMLVDNVYSRKGII